MMSDINIVMLLLSVNTLECKYDHFGPEKFKKIIISPLLFFFQENIDFHLHLSIKSVDVLSSKNYLKPLCLFWYRINFGHREKKIVLLYHKLMLVYVLPRKEIKRI